MSEIKSISELVADQHEKDISARYRRALVGIASGFMIGLASGVFIDRSFQANQALETGDSSIDDMQAVYAKTIMDSLNINVDGSRPVDVYEIKPGSAENVRDIFFNLSTSFDSTELRDFDGRLGSIVNTLNFLAIQRNNPCVVAPFPTLIEQEPMAHVQMACFKIPEAE